MKIAVGSLWEHNERKTMYVVEAVNVRAKLKVNGKWHENLIAYKFIGRVQPGEPRSPGSLYITTPKRLKKRFHPVNS